MDIESVKQKDLQACVDLAAEFYNEVSPQVDSLALQDYDRFNRLGIILNRLKSKNLSQKL